MKLSTISPVSWSCSEITNTFGVSDYLYNQEATKLQKLDGLLAEPKLRKGRPLSPATINAVTSFYLEDSNNFMRVLPGKKDCVSVDCKPQSKSSVQLLH